MKAALISLGSKSSEMTGEAMNRGHFQQIDLLHLTKIEVRSGEKKARSLRKQVAG